MSVLNEPTNKNFLSPLGFAFAIKRLPTVNFFVTRVNMPGVSLGVAETPTPFITIPRPGRLQFSEMSVTFKVDEDMKNYKEIYGWMTALGRVDGFESYSSIAAGEKSVSGEGIYSDGALSILTSAMNPNMLVTFSNMFPVSISDLDFTTQSADVEYLETTVSFRFQSFKIDEL
jgi:hypothetical protein